MSKLIITGNGLDLGHGLNTRFEDFIGTNKSFEEKYHDLKRGENNWNEVEKQFKDLVSEEINIYDSSVDVLSEVDDIVNSYGLNEYGEVDYYGYKSEAFTEELQKTEKWVKLLLDFEKDFLEYLRVRYSDSQLSSFTPKKKLQELFEKAERIINFNYTNVIEIIYGVNGVEHIHGDINNDIIIGCDYFERIFESRVDGEYPKTDSFEKSKEGLIDRMGYYEFDENNELVERTFMKRFFDEVVLEANRNEEELFRILKVRSKEFLPERERIRESLLSEVYDEVHIIGHSLGEADWSIFDALKGCTNVYCYYYDEPDRKSKEDTIQKNGWNFILVPNSEVFH